MQQFQTMLTQSDRSVFVTAEARDSFVTATVRRARLCCCNDRSKACHSLCSRYTISHYLKIDLPPVN